jgi:chemotaxis response regulator CheB
MAVLVLVVDDSVRVREKLQQVLSEIAHEVVGSGADGFDAVKKVRVFHPDIVTLDREMPNMSGLRDGEAGTLGTYRCLVKKSTMRV